jgi:hypothetical protein
MGFSFVEAFVLPQIAASLTAFVQAWMRMSNSNASTFGLGPLPALGTLAAHPLTFTTDCCWASPRSGQGSCHVGRARCWRWGPCWLQLLPSSPNASQPKMAIPVGLPLAWLGYGLWVEHRAGPVTPLMAEPAKAG